MPELTRRYVVMTMATEAPFDLKDPTGAFVLKPWKDPAALKALIAYRDHCYPELARDLDAWIQTIVAGPLIRGDVGERNQAHLDAARLARPAAKAAVTSSRHPRRGHVAPRPRASARRSSGARKKRRRR
jgi:hypothetical protein